MSTKGCRNARLAALTGAVAGALLMPAHGIAQDLDEIVVTAQKRQESIQDVAVGMTAIGSQELENLRINDFEDYLSLVPGLSSNLAGPVSDRGVRPIGLRGVQTVTGTIVNGQNTVGFYINDTPVPVANPRLVDLERIEVLRGPQGTLYGSSSLAGTVRLVTKRPELDDVKGHVEAGVSSVDNGGTGYEVEALVNLPLTDRAAFRLSAYTEEQSGYIDFVDVNVAGVPTGFTQSDVNDMSARGGRAAFRFDLTDRVGINASYMYSKRELDSADLITQGQPGISLFARFLMPRYDEFSLADVNIEWDAGPVTVVSTTALFDSKSDSVQDITDSLGPLLRPLPLIELLYTPFANRNEELTHETRVVSTADSAWQYVAGIFYTDREEVSHTFLPAYGKTSVLGVFPISNDTLFTNTSPRTRKEKAAFGEVTYRFTEQWAATVGLRYFDFDFETVDDFFGPTVLVPGGAAVLTGSAQEDGVVPKVRLEFRPTDDHLYYATASKGFRMGGANFPLPTGVPACATQVQAVFGQPTVPPGFESDSLWSYELGGKTSWAGGRLIANAAVYYIDWDNTQVASGSLCNFSGAVLNVGAVESRGAELEIQAVPNDRLKLGIAAAYLDAEVAERLQLPGATRVFAEVGAPMPDIPEWSLSATGDYSFPISATWQGFARLDYRYVTDRPVSLTTTAEKEAYGLGNFRFGTTNDRWTVSLYAENFTDEQPSLAGTPAATTLGTRGVDFTFRPRTYGMIIERQF
jgi:iron complex outermembrane recepter protein